MSYAVLVATVQDAGQAAAPAADATPSAPRQQMVRDTVTGEVSAWTIQDRAALRVGDVLAGPAIITEAETSTLVGPGWQVRLNTIGYLELQRGSFA